MSRNYFHVSSVRFTPGDLLTPADARPESAQWSSVYDGEHAWRSSKVWLFDSLEEALSYDPQSFTYRVWAKTTLHQPQECQCGEDAQGECWSLDCGLPDQYLADQAIVQELMFAPDATTVEQTRENR